MEINPVSQTSPNDSSSSSGGQERGALRQEERPTPDPLEVKAVRETLLSLSKVIKASRVYRSDNPAYQKLFQDLESSLTSFLQDREAMTWDFGQFHITYEGQTVYENRNPAESIAFHLYKDGIRQLRFYQGIELSEMQGFLEILKLSFFEPDADDDLATLFWEKDFPNIDPLVADILASAEEAGGGSDFTSLSQGLLEHGRRELESPPEAPSQASETGLSAASTAIPDLAAPSQARMVPIFALGDQEVERIKSEMSEEVGRDLGQEFGDLLMEILSAKEDIEGSKEILAIVERITDSYCLQGDFHKAFNNLSLLRGLLDSSSDLPESRRTLIRETIVRLGSPEKLKGLSKILNQVEESGLHAFISYVSLLGHDTIPSLSEILGELKQMKARRILCEAIAQMSQGHVDRLAPATKDSRWYVVRNMAYILGLMKDPKGVKYLKELVKHEEPRVRKEAIRAFGVIGDLESRNLLVGFLESPDSLVRISAARVLAALREKRALPILLKLIEEKELLNRDREEKRAIFEAIGQLGSDDLLPLLQKILFRKVILQRSKIEEIREGAALALALMGTAAAKKILQEGTKGKDRAIGQACRSALSEASRLPMRAGEEE